MPGSNLIPMAASWMNYLKQHHERFLNELVDYLRIPSVSAQSAHKKDVERCADWLVNHCRNMGLKTRLIRTQGHPIVLARTPRKKGSTKPHFMVYGHYDVQPPEPFDLWTSPPFEPRMEGDHLFARGSTDNKGQHFVHLKAVEAYLKTGQELPCDITFLIEGEEEVGSESLTPALEKLKPELDVAAVVVSDNGMPSLKHPALTYGLRGVTACEVTLVGPNRDLHSGIYGGAVDNPAMVLCQMLAQLRDSQGRVKVPGFYEDVQALSRLERSQARKFPLKDEAMARSLGTRPVWGKGLFDGRATCGTPHLGNQWADFWISGRRQQDHHPIQGFGEDHLSPGAQSGSQKNTSPAQTAPAIHLPQDRAPPLRGGAQRQGLCDGPRWPLCQGSDGCS